MGDEFGPGADGEVGERGQVPVAGVTPGNSLLVYFPLVAKANDLDPSRLTFVTMEASALLPTLLAGQIDAMPGFATVFELRNAETSAQGKPLRDFPFAKNGLKVYGECQFVAEQTIKSKPDLIARYMRATQKSLRWALANPDEAAHLLSAAYPELKEASVLVNHKAFMSYVFNETSEKVGLGGFDLEQVQRTFEAVKATHQVTARVIVPPPAAPERSRGTPAADGPARPAGPGSGGRTRSGFGDARQLYDCAGR